MKYSKRDREDAARICSARACEWGRKLCEFVPSDIADALGASREALNLAWAAFDTVPTPRGLVFPFVWADAEALIRTGWSPS